MTDAAHDDRRFASSRLYPVAPSALFEALADPVRLARWWGPAGFSNRFEVFEFREGGRWVFDMVGPDGRVYANASVFERIDPAGGLVVRHACAPLFTLTLSWAPEAGGTRLHWDQVFDELAVARAVRSVVGSANEQNLDRLGAELGLAPPGA